MSETAPFSLRLPQEIRTWVDARRTLTHRSTNAEIVALLEMFLESDPLTKVKIIKEKGRFITASAFSGEQFRSYGLECVARDRAAKALACVGQLSSNIILEIREAA